MGLLRGARGREGRQPGKEEDQGRKHVQGASTDQPKPRLLERIDDFEKPGGQRRCKVACYYQGLASVMLRRTKCIIGLLTSMTECMSQQFLSATQGWRAHA